MKIAIPRVTEFDIATIASGHFLTRGGGGLEQGDEEGTGSAWWRWWVGLYPSLDQSRNLSEIITTI